MTYYLYLNYKRLIRHSTIRRNLAIHRTTPYIIPMGKELLPKTDDKKYPPLSIGSYTVYPMMVEYINPIDKNYEKLENSYFELFKYIDEIRSGRMTQNLDKKFMFTDPRALHDFWRPELIEFCEEICADLMKADFSSGHII